jgi:hypothetical protein
MRTGKVHYERLGQHAAMSVRNAAELARIFRRFGEVEGRASGRRSMSSCLTAWLRIPRSSTWLP